MSFLAIETLGRTMTPANTGPSKSKVTRPTEKIVHGKRHLSQQEIRFVLPGRNRPKAGGNAEAKPFTDIFTAREPSCFGDHGANREIVRPSPSQAGADSSKFVDPDCAEAVRRSR